MFYYVGMVFVFAHMHGMWNMNNFKIYLAFLEILDPFLKILALT